MSNYNSDKHNRNNDVSSNISSIIVKTNENMNSYDDTSLSNVLTIDMNRNDKTIEIKKEIGNGNRQQKLDILWV